MVEPYEEMIDGEWLLRLPPRPTHEAVCAFLHRTLEPLVKAIDSTQLLPMRSQVRISEHHQFRPDLALLTRDTQKLWLAVEVINQEDHHADTVLKKAVYEEIRVTRLWIVDPRYENVEVYHATPYGLSLKETLMTKEMLAEALIPGFSIRVQELFSAAEGVSNLGPVDF